MCAITMFADRLLDRLVPKGDALAGTGSNECYRFRCGTTPEGLTCWDVCCRTAGGWDCRGCPCDEV